MKNKIRLFLIFMIISLLFSGCASSAYSEGVSLSNEYPLKHFPLYQNAVAFKYKLDKNVLDVSFGIKDTLDEVIQYYDTIQQNSAYNVVADKITDKNYVSAGEVDDFSYLLEVRKPKSASEKQHFETVVDLRIIYDEYYLDDFTITPTPELVKQVTASPVPATPTLPPVVPKPSFEESDTSKNINSNLEVLSTADLKNAKIFVECINVEQSYDGNRKIVSVLLKITNYGSNPSGFIDVSEFALKDENGDMHYTNSVDGIYGSGVNVLGGGFVFDYIRFEVDKNTKEFSLCSLSGIGNYHDSTFELLLYPLKAPTDANKYSGKVRLGEDIASKLPTFIAEQEYSFPVGYDLKLVDAEFFTNHTVQTKESLMYSFTMEFKNTSSTVIIPVEHQNFVLFDTYHNIYIKPTNSLTPFDELTFKPVASGLSNKYNISFEVFDETDETNLVLMVSSKKNSNEQILYKVR